MKFLILSTFFLLSFSNPAKADYIFNESIEYHPIDEPSPNKLLSKISKELKKKHRTSGRLFAYMAGSVQIKPRYIDLGKGKCGISSLKFTANSIYHIPQWKQKNNASQEIQLKWQTIYDNRVSHEKHHGEIRNKYMQEAYNKILKLEKRCKKIHRSVSKIIDSMSDQENRAHRSFDKHDGKLPTNFPN